jgi:hypothetical protein
VSEKVHLLSSAGSASEAAAAMTAPPSAKPQPKTFAHALARASLASSQALKTTGAAGAGKSGEEDPLAVALEKYAIAQEKVGEARLAQDAAIQARFLAGWSTTLNTQIQFATRARKGVEGARLSLDATKAKLRGHGGFSFSGGQRDHMADDENLSEEARAEIETKEDDLFAQTEESTGVMKNVSFALDQFWIERLISMIQVLDTPEPLRNLAELIAAQLEFHKKAYEILSELAPVVDQLQVEQEASYRKNREGGS